MRILILSDKFPPECFRGGAQVVFNLARGFKQGEVFVITTCKDRKKEGVDYHYWKNRNFKTKNE